MMTAADKPRKSRTPRREASRLPGEILEREVENLLELMQRVFLLAGDESNLDTLLEALEGYGISCTRLVTMLRAGQALSSSDETRRGIDLMIEQINAHDEALIAEREKGAAGIPLQPLLPDLDRPAVPTAPMPGNFLDD